MGVANQLPYPFQLGPHLHRDFPGMTVLNLGAGHCSSPISKQFITLQCQHLTNVEVFRPVFNELVTLPFVAPVTNICEDIIRFVSKTMDNSYDLIVMLDVIEHFSRQNGEWVIERLTKIARHGVCLFLPMKECPQDDLEDNPWQRHLSTWVAEDFPAPWVVEYYPEFHTHVQPPADAAWVTLYDFKLKEGSWAK